MLGVWLVFLPERVESEISACDVPIFNVSATEQTVARHVCKLAKVSVAVLASCGILSSYPVTFVVANPGSPIQDPSMGLAHYNQLDKKIYLPNPAHLPRLLSEHSPLRLLYTDELFASLVVHEMVHAQLIPSPLGEQLHWAEHEYIAFAIQFHSLPAASRKALLDKIPVSTSVDLHRFNSIYLEIAPNLFTEMVWRHFSQPENGCRFVARVIVGDVKFSVGPP